jgi:hypothetical protein
MRLHTRQQSSYGKCGRNVGVCLCLCDASVGASQHKDNRTIGPTPAFLVSSRTPRTPTFLP